MAFVISFLLGLIFCHSGNGMDSKDHMHFDMSNIKLSQGQHLYEDLELKRNSPSYGSCWTSAIRELHIGCNDLTEFVQQRLAIRFAKCFLASSGKDAPDCSENLPPKDCLATADGTMFSAYQTYFVHTQSICFYLKSQLWQENTQNLIKKLGTTSHEVVKRLENVNTFQNKILDIQSQSVRAQESILKQGQEIGETIKISHHEARETFELYRQTTVEQKDIINRIFDRILALQSSVFGLFSGFNSFVFYIIAFLVSYFVTSQTRTSSARFWIVILWVIGLVLEYRFKPEPLEYSRVEGNSSSLNQETWTLYLRSAITILNASILFYHYRTFRDYPFLNWQAHRNVERKVSLLFRHLEGLSTKLDGVTHSQRLSLLAAPFDSSDDDDRTFRATSSEESAEEEDQDDSLESNLSRASFLESGIETLNRFLSSETPFRRSITAQDLNDSACRNPYNLRSRRSLNPADPVLNPGNFAGFVRNVSQGNIVARCNTRTSTARQFSRDED